MGQLSDRSIGAATIVGSVVWILVPWAQTIRYGTRPYVGTAFDPIALIGWLGVAVGIVGARRLVGRSSTPTGISRVSLGLLVIGTTAIALLLGRATAIFVAAGFEPVAATGEDPAGLVLTWLFLFGYASVLFGAGGLGIAIRRGVHSDEVGIEPIDRALSAGLIAAPTLPAIAIVLDSLSVLPISLSRFLVSTNAVLVPFAIAWVLLGYRLTRTNLARGLRDE